jgi:hypothetical protein
MPIRINLLAEAQAAEEIRRKDPVKRAIWGSIVLVCAMLVWIGSRQVKIIADNVNLGNLEARLSSRTNQFVTILNNKTNLDGITEKLGALNRMVTNRFLEANVLDALQHTTVAGIQLLRLRTEQIYEETPGTKPIVEKGKTIPGKPGGSTERIKLLLDAKDASENPGGDQINKFREMLACTPYFQKQNILTNNIRLKTYSSPQLDNESGKAYVLFSLECSYPDHVR